MTIKKYHLHSMPSAQCHVEIMRGDYGELRAVRLVSYRTTMLTLEVDYNNDSVVCKVNYHVDCSKTTARHVNRFTTEFFGENKYHELKKLGDGNYFDMSKYRHFVYDSVMWYEQRGKRW